MRGLPGLYAVVAKAAVQTQFQYRTANYAYMLGMVAEPVVYLVVWSAVANSRGGFGIASLNLTVQADGSTSVGTVGVPPAAPVPETPTVLPTAAPTIAPTPSPAPTSAPMGTAIVSGVVKDAEGPLAGADVFLTSTADAGYQAQVETDESGAFSFENAPTGGTLVLLASKDGFKARSRALTALKPGDEVSYAFALESR